MSEAKPDGADSLNDEIEPLLLTAKQVAALLQIGERTLWRHVRHEKLPRPLRVGGATRWRRDAVERWVDEGCPPKSSRGSGWRAAREDCASKLDARRPPGGARGVENQHQQETE